MSVLVSPQGYNLSDDLFISAKNAFIDSLPADTKVDFKQCRTSTELLEEAEQFNSFRSNRKLYAKPLENLKRFSDHLEPYFNIIGIAISSNPDAAALVWSAIRLILKLASNFGSFFDKLSELLDDYGQKLPRFQEITNLAQGKCSDGFRSTLKNIYMDLFELFTAIAQVFTKKDGSLQSAPIVAWKLSWQPFHIRYQNFLDRLQKHTIAFDDERKFLQLTVAMESQSLQEQHHQLTKEYFALVEESKSRWDTNKRGRIIRKILPAPYHAKWPYDEAKQQHLPGTSQWILEDNTFTTWIATDSASGDVNSSYTNLLWIKGNPGTGKTVLATEVLHRLQTRSWTKDQPHATASHFFSFRYDVTRCLRSAWSTLVSQLFRQLQNWDEIVDQFAFIMVKSEHQYATSAELIALLHVIALRVPNLVLLLDGIDECEDPENVITTLAHSQEGTEAKAVILSRPNIQFLHDRLDRVPHIHLTREKAKLDIQTYIRYRLQGFKPSQFPARCSHDWIEARIMRGANGIILWAKLMFNYLQLDLGPEDRETAIESLRQQEEMTDMYIRILNYIATRHEKYRSTARRIFSWLSFPTRYLSEDQLWEVTYCIGRLSEPPGLRSDPSPTEAQRSDFHKSVIMICGCLVERIGGQYHLVHQSVVEFFWSGFKEPKCQNPVLLQFLPTPSQAHNDLATECLSYLLSRVPAKPLSGDIRQGIGPGDLFNHLPFACYAATSWPIHLEKGAKLLEESLSEALGFPPADIKSFLQLLQALDKFTSTKLTLNTWVEIQYLVASDISHLDGILEWLNVVNGLSVSDLRLPNKFRDLPNTLQRFVSEFSHLETQWGPTLRKKPHEIWGDVTAFFKTEFLARTKAVFISSMAPSSFGDDTLGSEPLATCSRDSAGSGSQTERLACLNVWPSRKFQEAVSGKNAASGLIKPEACSGWVAQYEVYDTKPLEAVKIHDIRVPLNDDEVFEHVQSSLEYRKTGQNKTTVQKEWSLTFPIAISPNLDMLVILRSVCFLENVTPVLGNDGDRATSTTTFKFVSLRQNSQLTEASITKRSSRARLPREAQSQLRVTESYCYKFNHDGRYLLREKSRCLPTLFQIKTTSDFQTYELQVTYIDQQKLSCSVINQYRPPGSMTTIRACSFHPTLPLLLFYTTCLGQCQLVFLWSFNNNTSHRYQPEASRNQLFNLWSPCQQKSGIESVDFSTTGNEIIIGTRHSPNPEVVDLQTDEFYDRIRAQNLEKQIGHEIVVRGTRSQDLQQISSTTSSLGYLTSVEGMQLNSQQALVVGSSSYHLDMSITESHNALQMKHTVSGAVQAKQDILSFPNTCKVDNSIKAVVTQSNSAPDTAKIVLHQDAPPFYDLGKTAKSIPMVSFPMVVHKSINAMQPPRYQTGTDGRKRRGSEVDYNRGNRRKLEDVDSGN
ncbi:hypothetical protein FOXG_07204 [Fusarium oxysporum f. sp. lycopersici 4287]|uniref:Uncharacterized protein n=1 Tax=Fusarium oxysporum f. sp. lycopersici (strain 4287 / CBS 123668 / FGSC 9935 / NRRL 34936) TaxID=426428 RepID=A0A0J9V5J8_FUSO4|nr:hypothetical protein FOXG_07204 [Fusarium oxysporum f. sp. lycopersici 4287]KNB06510.1 hypothetical protein FOXG_07204 [Fusarium oxysporum f. sp. lycopersici 4287]